MVLIVFFFLRSKPFLFICFLNDLLHVALFCILFEYFYLLMILSFCSIFFEVYIYCDKLSCVGKRPQIRLHFVRYGFAQIQDPTTHSMSCWIILYSRFQLNFITEGFRMKLNLADRENKPQYCWNWKYQNRRIRHATRLARAIRFRYLEFQVRVRWQ